MKKVKKRIVGYIFRPYITKNGVKIYPKKAKVFRIPVYEK